MIKVEITGEKAARDALATFARMHPKETARALNKTAQRSATRTRRGIAREVGLPQREIKDRIQHFRASARRLVASVWVGVRVGIPLGKVQGARTGLSGILRAGRLRVQTFRARMPSGYRGQFVRKPDSTHRQRPDGQWTELPIEEPKVRIGPVAQPIVRDATEEQMREFFPAELKRLVTLAAKRSAKRTSS